MQLQPSEIMKIALVLALARYFHCLPAEDVGRLRYLIVPALMVVVPAALVLKQPDLGTAMMLLATGAALFFLAGVRLRIFAAAAAGGGRGGAAGLVDACAITRRTGSIPFSIPSATRSAPAITSCSRRSRSARAGCSARAFCNGTQSHLSFLPEKQTDFIFTMIAEEFGLVGGLVLLALYIAGDRSMPLRSRCAAAASSAACSGSASPTNFFLYAFINTAMVMGLIPVVGVPLPLISYGGTAMITVMFGFGLLMNVGIHRDVRISRHGESRLG